MNVYQGTEGKEGSNFLGGALYDSKEEAIKRSVPTKYKLLATVPIVWEL